MTRLVRIVIWFIAMGLTVFIALTLFRGYAGAENVRLVVPGIWFAGVAYLTYFAFWAPIEPPGGPLPRPNLPDGASWWARLMHWIG